ncbi:MAG TPA: FeoB-associated Cys-rich membrane protein [Pyrinomonadaceae bacterium]
MQDWQTILVFLVIFAASLFAVRRAWLKFRGLSDSSCATGCGKCGAENSSSAKLFQIIRR